MTDDASTIDRTIAFLRMAAHELRRIAETDPAMAAQLRHMAEQCDREAAELSEKFGRPANNP